MSKKTLRTITQRASINYISGTLEEFITSLIENVERAVPEEYRATAYLDLTQETASYSDSEYGVISIHWARPETSEEAAAREKDEARWAEVRRQQYEQLKKEFE